ncbi:MAG TPA: hypothetical protein VMY78_05730 [Solirubrobacteraceae bacterium]|nr:hypothetical protein [Solirubrobacteraceae bacterium]
MDVVVDLEQHAGPAPLQLGDRRQPGAAARLLQDDGVVAREIVDALDRAAELTGADRQRGGVAADADPVGAERARRQRAAIPARGGRSDADEEDVHE